MKGALHDWSPLAWYLGLTLGIPVLGGAPLDARFLEHALTVVFVSAALAAAWRWVRPSTLPRAAHGSDQLSAKGVTEPKAVRRTRWDATVGVRCLPTPTRPSAVHRPS